MSHDPHTRDGDFASSDLSKPANAYRAHLRRRLATYNVPPTLHDGLIEYVAARRPTGSFLRAVLENDLRQAVVRADDLNRYALAHIVFFLDRYVPSAAWGSAAAVERWLADPAPVPEIFE